MRDLLFVNLTWFDFWTAILPFGFFVLAVIVAFIREVTSSHDNQGFF